MNLNLVVKVAVAAGVLLPLGCLSAAPPAPVGCIYALDPSAHRALQIAGAQSVYTACSVIVESTASDAFEMEGSETLYLQNHSSVGVVGGSQLNGNRLFDTIANAQVQPVTVATPGDPLASLQPPTSGSVVSASPAYFDMNRRPPSNTLGPGVYCGGLSIGNTGGVAFTLSPGTYILAGGGLTINSQARVQGTGVTIYNAASAGWGCSGNYNYSGVTIDGQANVTLSAPTSGPLSGILFFGARNGCANAGNCQDRIIGGSSTNFTGALYFKSDQLVFSGSSATGYMMLVADMIQINGNSTFGTTGSPFNQITVGITPSSAVLYGGGTQQFTASVANTGNPAVSWKISPASGAGTISATGLYTAPATVTATQTVNVTATSQADNTKSATATVTLSPPVSVTVSPATATLYGGGMQQFTANGPVTWTVAPTSGAGTISATGLYTAPATVTATQTVNVTATSQADNTKSATATVTLSAPVSVTVSPATATLYGGGMQQFTANGPVTWTVAPATGAGTISATGLYTAPATITATQTVTVTATSQTDGTKSATATVTLTPPVSVTVSPATATLYGGGTQQFMASVTNAANQAVAWTVLPATSAGTISATGLYTAPASVTAAQNVTVTATSQVDGTKSATAAVALSQPISVTLTPTAPTVYVGQTQTFKATVANTANQAVTWSLSPATGAGAIDLSTGIYTAPTSLPSPLPTITVTATSQADTTKSGNSTITLSPAISVTVAPSAPTVYVGQTQTFKATIANTTNQAVTWSLSPATGAGSIDATGLYTAPSTLPSPVPAITITALSQADNATTGTAAITLSASLQVTPTTASVPAGQTQQFTANTNVTWSVVTPGAGSISATGLYTAPPCITAAQTVTIRATSTANPTIIATATVTLPFAGAYSYRRALVIDHTKVPNTDQTNFPALVSLTDPTLASASNGGHVASATGYDLIFTSDAGCATKLNHEVESWNAATGQLLAWVQVPLLSHTADTPLYVCYGNSAITADQSSKAAVWDSNYLMVQHFPAAGPLTANDSTANAINGALIGTTPPSRAAGVIGGAASFDGVTSGILFVRNPVLDAVMPSTIEAWIKPGFVTSDRNLITVSDYRTSGTSADYFDFGISGAGSNGIQQSPRFGYYNRSTPYVDDFASAKLGPNVWAHLVYTLDSTGNWAWYVNGAPAGGGANGPNAPSLGTNVLRLGQALDTVYDVFYQGLLDDFRISKTNRSADWIATEYSNQSSPATFYTLNAENAAVTVTPAAGLLFPSRSLQLNAIVNGCSSPLVNWSIPASAPGTITGSGLYTAPSSLASAQTVIATAASQADATRTGTATLTLLPKLSVTVNPAAPTLAAGQTQQFTAAASDGSATPVTWSIAPATAGAITSTGLYAAPSGITATQKVTVTALSTLDGATAGTALISLVSRVSPPTFSPTPATYAAAQSVTLTSATPSASIRYTTDGTTPTSSTGIIYTSPFPVSANTTVKAIAYLAGLGDSTVSSGAYSFTAVTSTALFVTTDGTSQGSWIGMYGSDGYYIPSLPKAVPSYAALSFLTPDVVRESVSAPSTYDVRALQKPLPASDRISSYVTRNGYLTGDLNLTDGKVHQLALYFDDWASSGYVETVTILDAATQTVLDTRAISNFSGGKYLVWALSGHVQILMNYVSNGDPYINGFFFDPPGVTVSPQTATVAPGQTQQFTAVVSSGTNQSVTWTVNPASAGTISPNGLFTAPNTVATDQVISIKATSQADASKSGASAVTLTPGISGGPFGQIVGIIAEQLCRHAHPVPTVDAGLDQATNCSSGACAASATLNGAAANYALEPGKSLSYAWDLLTGPAPVVFSAPNSAITQASFTAPGQYTLQLSVNDGIATGAGVTHVTVNPAPIGMSFFSLAPAVSGPNAVNTAVTLRMQLYGSYFGLPAGPLANYSVHLQISGANPQTADLVTDPNGIAVFPFTGRNPGVDTAAATANAGTLGTFAANTATITWAAAPAKLTTSPVTAQFFPADGSGVFNTLPTAAPAFTQVFPQINFNPAPANQTRPFTDILTDRNGNPAGQIVAQGSTLQAGVPPLYAFSAVLTGTLNVPAAGPVTFAFSSDDAFVFSVGGSATFVSGPRTNTPALSPFKSYPVMGGVNVRTAPASSAVTVNFPAAGAYPYELDYAKGGDSHLTLSMSANGSLIPAAALLTLTPSAVPSTTAGGIQQFTLSATDVDGIALANLPVTFSVTGQNAQTRLLTTDAAGQAGFAYAGSPLLFGPDTVQAAAHVGASDTYSNAVTVNWNSGVNQAPAVSAGANQSVTLPAQAVLAGTAADDGLPSNTLTVAWTLVSGPASVTFDNPAQATTAAAFTTPGTYLLQLSASDGSLTATSTTTVTVSPATTWSAGWLANPLDGSTVTGQVPVTLIPNLTLVGGSLTYYPVNHPEASVTLNANTTGAGQIAVLDTTLLNNGAYFVILTATNSLGVTQGNQALITVAGDYKPGRVTATVTDFTVPSAGLAIQIQRTYDSLDRANIGDFGNGWRLGLNAVNLAVSATSDVTLTIAGKRRTFYFTPQPNQIFQTYYQPQYTGEPGVYGSLVTTGDNCSGVLQRVGNIYECAINNAGSVFQATGYKYTDPYGRVYTVGANGALQSLKDLNGNTLTLAPTGITSTTGLNIPFLRDAQGRITQITDAVGNLYRYAYDANGNLTTVTLPSIAQPIAYGYDATHLLTSERDPRGSTGSTAYYPDGKLKSTTDAAGQTTSFVYAANTTAVTYPDGGTVTTVADAYGMPLTVTDAVNRTTTYTYDAQHNKLTELNPLSQQTTYTYDSNGFRTSLKDPLNNIWSAAFNPVGGPVSVTNPLAQTQTVAYDANFNLSAITDTLGQVAAFTYNGQGLPLTLRDARGNTSSYAYDAHGNRTGYTDPLTRNTTSVFDNQGRMTSQTDPRGNTTTYGYDGLSRKTSMTDANLRVTTYVYDANGNKTGETDPLGRTTTYTYDAVNRMTKVTYPDATTRTYTYDYRGNKLTETDQLGRVTTWVYDKAGQLTSTTFVDATTSHTYDLAGRKLTDTDPRGNTTTYSYDAAGRMTGMRDAVGNLTTYGYDAKGQRTSMLDAKNRTTSYTYDSRGRQLITTTPDMKTVTKGYDGLGLVTSVLDEESRSTQYQYDAASQLKTVIDSLNQQTQYGYDLSGNKITQTDANTHTTTYLYDKLNRRTQRTLPLGQSESMTYDAVGNLVTRTDFNGKTTTYAYDPLNRLLSKTPDPSFAAQPNSFTYTPTGQRASMTDPSGTTTYTYTNRDQAATKATPQGTLNYTYDLAGNVTSGNGATYAWDANNRLASVAGTTYTYDATNQIATVTYPNGFTHNYAYDVRDRILTLNGYTQTFSPSGRKQSVIESTGRTSNYSYDAIYRLLNETTNDGALTYLLDPVGNRQSLTSTLAALQSQTSTYDANDRIASDTFDANGNTTASGGVTYTYDFEDRLLSTSTGVQMVYDGDGNRVSETVAGVTTKFLVDHLTPTGYAQVAQETVNGAVTAQFTYGPMRISQTRSGVTSYYGYDAGGSVRQLLDTTGAVTDTYTYDAFGNTVTRTGTTINEFQYRGEQYDPALGMYYLRARYYRPQVGTFLTHDSNEGEAKLPRSLHKYVYAAADPVNRIDPSGFAETVETSVVLEGDAAGLYKLQDIGRTFGSRLRLYGSAEYSPADNLAFVRDIISNRRLVVLFSDLTIDNLLSEGLLSVFGQEFLLLIEAGYEVAGPFLLPPGF